MSPTEEAGERLRRTERVISYVRLGVVLFNVASYQLLAPDIGSRRGIANAMCVLATLYAVVTFIYRPTSGHTFGYAWGSLILDTVLIGVWVYATGGFSSPYYPLWYAETAASIGRFGVVAGNLSGVGSAFVYLTVVGLDGFEGVAYRLSVRIAYIFVISAFVSYVVEVARKSEREAAAAEREAAAYLDLDRLRQRFVTNISHELRTPLTAIRGASATLARREVSTDQKETLVGMIDRQSERLSSLVQDIIDMGLADQGRLAPTFDQADLLTVVSEVVEETSERTDRKIDLITTAPGEMGAICDAAKIGNAVGKLLDNAIKFSGVGSRVTVTLESTPAAVKISVEDEGIGITPEDMTRVFDRFHQIDDSHTRAAGGTGIGLSIAKTIMDLHGGAIDVSSTAGQGSRFTLSVPRDPDRVAVP